MFGPGIVLRVSQSATGTARVNPWSAEEASGAHRPPRLSEASPDEAALAIPCDALLQLSHSLGKQCFASRSRSRRTASGSRGFGQSFHGRDRRHLLYPPPACRAPASPALRLQTASRRAKRTRSSIRLKTLS